jgi:hypothetical protein
MLVNLKIKKNNLKKKNLIPKLNKFCCTLGPSGQTSRRRGSIGVPFVILIFSSEVKMSTG